jgi:hypothetical protein
VTAAAIRQREVSRSARWFIPAGGFVLLTYLLPTAADYLRCGVVHLKLGAHFLEASSERFDLLLLLSDNRFQVLHLVMFFEELIEQHRVHCVVAHGVDVAVLIARHQARVHLGHFLRDQTKLRRICVVALVVKRHRLKRQDSFAGFVHRLNLFLESARGAHRAQLACGVDHDRYSIVVCRCHPENVPNKAAAAHIRAICADTDDVIGCGDNKTTTRAQGDIAVAGIVNERIITVGRVAGARSVTLERKSTDSRVGVAASVAKEGLNAVGRVGDAGGVAMERSKTSGRVVRAIGVAIERCVTMGRVAEAGGVVGERISASADVKKPAGVAEERKNASGSVVAAIGIVSQGSETGRCILVAGSEVVNRLENSAGVPDPRGAADEYPNTFAIVGAGYVTVRVGTHRLRHRCKPKARKQQQDEK